MMPTYDLFPPEQIIGVFRGFRESGMEFHADLVLPYRSEFQSRPMHGQFVLVQLETPDEAVLGRIAAFEPAGKLAHDSGEEFTLRALRDGRPVPEDLRQDYLKYRVNIRVLGLLRCSRNKLLFIASHRRLPHVGSPVAFAAPDVLREIAGHNVAGTPIGHLALGEYIYAEGSTLLTPEDWMQVHGPEVLVKFPVTNLVARRSFIFARAGFGKSNLNKLLFSRLYEGTPTIPKRGGYEAPVGTIIFDREGEYFWPDDKGRPGLCDIPHLEQRLVVFTSREPPSPFYGSFVAGGIRLDIRKLRPADVIGISLSPERQEQQNVRKLAALSQGDWAQLVDQITQHRYELSSEVIGKFLGLSLPMQEAEALAARSNMVSIVTMLHDPTSQLMDLLVTALQEGKLCIVDVSQMRDGQALVLSGIILRYLFDRNQREFTSAQARTIPVIAVIEEAQAVLDERKSGTEPYITWVKEGRKYDLGALLITQQPGSIPTDILSQGDNWFIFHLLSGRDLATLKNANAHFSDDLLSALLNEPIVGQGVFWSSVSGKSFPVPLRALSFEAQAKTRDPQYTGAQVDTYAVRLKAKARQQLVEAWEAQVGRMQPTALRTNGGAVSSRGQNDAEEDELTRLPLFRGAGEAEAGEIDQRPLLVKIAAIAIQRAPEAEKLDSDGLPWGALNKIVEAALPGYLIDRRQQAYELVAPALDKLYGRGGWSTFKRNDKTWVRVGASTKDHS
jgi:hypothetical protein